jgi:hypothetical protein
VIHRRTFLAGLFSAFAAPAIVRAENIMPVRLIVPSPPEILVRGVRWQSWPLGQPHPETDFAQGSIGPESGGGVVKPLSHFLKRMDWHRRHWPGLVWEPMPAVHIQERK